MKFGKFIKLLNGKRPTLAVLIDPDKYDPSVVRLAAENKTSLFLVGGSSLNENIIAKVIGSIKKISDLPVILFPGDESQLTKNADGLLLLSLLSGRNPEYLIGKHVKAAPMIKKLRLPFLPVAYLLIGSNGNSTTQAVTGTEPMVENNINEIIFTSLAGEQLGFKAIYLEAGSGSANSISPQLVKKIKQQVSIPVIVGGGINSQAKAIALIKAGASMIVVGNALERDKNLIKEISKAF